MSQNFFLMNEKNWRDTGKCILQGPQTVHLPLNPLRSFLFLFHIRQGKVYLSRPHAPNHPSPVFTLPLFKK